MHATRYKNYKCLTKNMKVIILNCSIDIIIRACKQFCGRLTDCKAVGIITKCYDHMIHDLGAVIGLG